MGLRGMDPGVFGRALRIVGREDIIDARTAIAANRAALDLELLRELALRFGRGTAHTLETLLAEPS